MGDPTSAQMLTFPAWTATNIGITSLQVLSACTSGIGEANGDNAGYSKFADATATWNVPSRVGMFIIYIAGLLVSMWVIPSAESPRTIMIAWMLFGHYLKREVEVMCVHKWAITIHADNPSMVVIECLVVRYSGQIHLPSSCMISVAYGLAALGVSHFTEDAEQQLRMASRHREQQQLDSMDVVAAVLYVIGQLGNGYHHMLLASLRSDKTKGYVLPCKGLFPLVACPHYFFELVSWAGVALGSRSLFGYLNLASMIHYLAGRSFATSRWYRTKFGSDYPAERRNIVPFVF